MEDLANILTAIHANKATDSNKDQKKQTSETAAIKRNEKINQKTKHGIK